jgi:anaerobic selenocysteine-containing dehydrogenase
MLPDSDATVRVIREMRFSVVVDSFLTDTARLATVVLPTTTLLEADDILGSYGHHYLGIAQPVVAAPSGVKSDLEIIQALAQRVGLGAELAGTAREWKQRLVATRLKDHGIDLETIERGAFKNPLARTVVFEGKKFATASGKVNLVRESPPLAARPSPDYPLFLLSISTPKSQCSQWANAPELPLPLTVHPSAAPGFADGEVCEIESVIGRMPVRIVLDPDQRPDIALLPKGGPRAASACANMLIRAQTTDLGEGGALYEECVRIVPRA